MSGRESENDKVFTEEVFLQKLNYIHNNPVQSKWHLAEFPEEYSFSSAKFYEIELREILSDK
jgi:putative transposase